MGHRARTLTLTVLIAVMSAATGMAGSLAGPPAVRGATTVEICGEVTAYVRPTVLLAGALTVGAAPFVIAAGTSVSSEVQAGADVCLRLTLNAAGSVTQLVAVDASATSRLKLCGVVTAYARATATKTGSLTIAGTTLKIAHAVDLPASVEVGADICVDFTLNAFSQVSDGDVTANATSTLRICGVVTAHAEATATKTGSLEIAGRKLTLAIGADLPASVDVGADLCLTLELNGFGQVEDGNAQANVTSTLRVCGEVSGYSAATLNKTGSISIGGRTLTLALGSKLPAAFENGADLCATLELNAFGQIQDGTAQANVTSSLVVCGQVTSYSAATATGNGSLTIGSTSRTIAAGTDVAASVRVGAFLKLRLELDVFGRISKVTVLKVAASVAAACDDGTTPTPTPSPNPGASATPNPNASPSPSPNPGASATPNPNASPSPNPGASATPNPNASPSPSSNPGASASPNPNASPTPEPTASSTPDPTATGSPPASPTPGPSGHPLPVPTPAASTTPVPSGPPGGDPGPAASSTPGPGDPVVPGPEVCPPAGTTSHGAAPVLPADASPVERAGSLMAAMAIPFAMFAMGMLGAGLLTRWRRRDSRDAADLEHAAEAEKDVT